MSKKEEKKASLHEDFLPGGRFYTQGQEWAKGNKARGIEPASQALLAKMADVPAEYIEGDRVRSAVLRPLPFNKGEVKELSASPDEEAALSALPKAAREAARAKLPKRRHLCLKDGTTIPLVEHEGRDYRDDGNGNPLGNLMVDFRDEGQVRPVWKSVHGARKDSGAKYFRLLAMLLLFLCGGLCAPAFGEAAVNTGGVSNGTQRWDGKKIFKKGGYTATTMTGNATLYITSDSWQKFSPNGSNRTITLPAEAKNEGLSFNIMHGDGANTLTVQDDAAATVITLSTGQMGFVVCNGSAWIGQAVDSSASGFLAADGSVAGATGQAQDFGTNGIKADVVAESTGATGVTIDSLLIKDGAVDLNGTADAVILDADGDTTISAPTANQIDIEVAGADDFTITANTFTALSGSSIATDTIAETTGASGVTIDGALIKDGNVYIDDSAGDNTLQITSATDEAGNYTVTIPDLAGNDTFAFIGVGQTFSGANVYSGTQTFNSGKFYINDTGDDHTIQVISAADNAANRVLSVPALGANDTLMTLATPGTITGNLTATSGTFFLNDTGDDHTISLLSAADNAANRTLSIPALGANDTLMTLATPGTVTGNLTFTSGTCYLNDTGDDHTIQLLSAADNAANRTLSIPALGANDTLMTLAVPGTVTGNATFSGSVIRTGQKTTYTASTGHVGGTAGFVVNAAADTNLVTCPASQTASTFVVPIAGLKTGCTITGFGLIGQIESAGNLVTIDADLRVHTAAAGDVTDASVSTITQISKNADYAVTATDDKTGLSQAVDTDETYYVLITVTTNASTDVALQGVTLIVTED